MLQDKKIERDFFDNLASTQEYNVFTEAANQKIVTIIEKLLNLTSGDNLIDLGCGSGIFTHLLAQRGFHCTGIDLSYKLLSLGKNEDRESSYLQADVEALPLKDNSCEKIILSCLIHHLPDPTQCIREVHRVLKPGGQFVAFDPNRLNPFMYLYRDKSSPFYSAKGVTPNERPVLPCKVRKLFSQIGFKTGSYYVEGLSYRYVESENAQRFLPIYNFIDKICFRPFWMKPLRAFVFTYGCK